MSHPAHPCLFSRHEPSLRARGKAQRARPPSFPSRRSLCLQVHSGPGVRTAVQHHLEKCKRLHKCLEHMKNNTIITQHKKSLEVHQPHKSSGQRPQPPSACVVRRANPRRTGHWRAWSAVPRGDGAGPGSPSEPTVLWRTSSPPHRCLGTAFPDDAKPPKAPLGGGKCQSRRELKITLVLIKKKNKTLHLT